MKESNANQVRPVLSTNTPQAIQRLMGAFVCIQGRYPDTGYALNLRCKEMAYIISGSGRVVVDGNETPLSKGSIVLILPGEQFFWGGTMEMFMPCTPA